MEKKRLTFIQVPATRCVQCERAFASKRRGKAGVAQRFCTRRCFMLWQYRKGQRQNWTWMKPGLEAHRSPSMSEVAWAAGIFEGEGWSRGSRQYSGLMVAVGQKGRWLPDRLAELFGGSVLFEGIFKSGPYRGRKRGYQWHIHGVRARGFLMTMYAFLSTRRQGQIRKILATG